MVVKDFLKQSWKRMKIVHAKATSISQTSVFLLQLRYLDLKLNNCLVEKSDVFIEFANLLCMFCDQLLHCLFVVGY